LLGAVSDREQLVDDGGNSRDSQRFEVAPMQLEQSAAEKYVNVM